MMTRARIANPTLPSLPPGEYPAHWTGYVATMRVGEIDYALSTNGPAPRSGPALVIVRDHMVQVMNLDGDCVETVPATRHQSTLVRTDSTPSLKSRVPRQAAIKPTTA